MCFFPQVKIQPVAKYDWEHKYYYGNLIAVSNAYLAYAIRGKCAWTGCELSLDYFQISPLWLKIRAEVKM